MCRLRVLLHAALQRLTTYGSPFRHPGGQKFAAVSTLLSASAQITLQPSSTRRSAIALPMPLAAPVTIATLPCKFLMLPVEDVSRRPGCISRTVGILHLKSTIKRMISFSCALSGQQRQLKGIEREISDWQPQPDKLTLLGIRKFKHKSWKAGSPKRKVH